MSPHRVLQDVAGLSQFISVSFAFGIFTFVSPLLSWRVVVSGEAVFRKRNFTENTHV